MGAKRLEELDAYRLALEFKLAVYAVVHAHPRADNDLRYKGQLFEAALSVESNIAEGWRRFGAREMSQFLRFALGSLEEAKRRLRDGVHRRHFAAEDIEAALVLGDRCGAATMGLWKSLRSFTDHRGPKPHGNDSGKSRPSKPKRKN